MRCIAGLDVERRGQVHKYIPTASTHTSLHTEFAMNKCLRVEVNFDVLYLDDFLMFEVFRMTKQTKNNCTRDEKGDVMVK